MLCEDFIFKQTSGQLESLELKDRLLAKAHTLICQKCRDFQKNDRILSRYLKKYRDQIEVFEK